MLQVSHPVPTLLDSDAAVRFRSGSVLTLLQGVLITGGAVILSLGSMLLVRRRVALATLEAHQEVAGFVYAVVGVIYAVLLAFVVIVVWDQFEETKAHVEAEANALADLGRLASGFPAQDRQRLQHALLVYTRVVLDEEFPALRHGAASHRSASLVDDVWGAYRQVDPRTDREAALYTQSLARLTDFADARRLRLFDSGNDVPAMMWAVLGAGGVLTVGFSFLFGVQNVRAQAVIVGVLAAVIALQLVLIYALDSPFRGDFRVRPEPFERALMVLEREAGEAAR